MAYLFMSDAGIVERERFHRLAMMMSSALLRDTIMAEHPRIVWTLLKKQKGK